MRVCYTAVAALIACCGCATHQGRLQGWFVSGTSLLQRELPPPNPGAEAFLQRDSHTNALPISISSSRPPGLGTSMASGSYWILATLQAPNAVPQETPELLCPLLQSGRIRLERVSRDTSATAIHVVLSTDRLGVDLFLATLFSPHGLRGLAYFPSTALAVPFQARADEPWYPFATLWVDSTDAHQILLRSEVEYPVFVDALTVGRFASTEQETVVVKKTLRPWQNVRLRLPDSSAPPSAAEVAIRARRVRTVPYGLTRCCSLYP